jgi:hypothetical protein
MKSLPEAFPDSPELTGRLGGALGSHTKVGGSWFDPVPWVSGAAVLTWLIVMLRQLPCIQTDLEEKIDVYARLCYSDIPILYRIREAMFSGGPLFSAENPLEYPTLTGGFIWLARKIAGWFGAEIGADLDDMQKLHSANIYFAVNAVLLFICFTVLVWAHLQMGRDSATSASGGIRVRTWDALFIAISPAVMLTGLINWDLFPVALTSLGLLLWARKRPAAAGIIIGLAAAAKFYPLAIIPVLALLCIRAGKMGAFGKFFGGAAISWSICNVPLMLSDFDGWAYFWVFNKDRGADLGSLWYVLELAGIKVPYLSILETGILAVGGCLVIALVFSAPRRPRVAQVALLVMVFFLAFNKVYSPQYVLWLLPFVVLARPKVFDIAVFTISEALYYLAVWGLLNGLLGHSAGRDGLYWLSVFLRIGVQLWLAIRVVEDIRQPWLDPVRLPNVDDPLGGVLDHAPDAAFLLQGRETAPDKSSSAKNPSFYEKNPSSCAESQDLCCILSDSAEPQDSEDSEDPQNPENGDDDGDILNRDEEEGVLVLDLPLE